MMSEKDIKFRSISCVSRLPNWRKQLGGQSLSHCALAQNIGPQDEYRTQECTRPMMLAEERSRAACQGTGVSPKLDNVDS